MKRRVALAALANVLIGASTLAADLPSAQNAFTGLALPPDPSWKGFYAGAGVGFSAVKGVKGVGLGGEAFAGYDWILPNGMTGGFRASTGATPSFFPGASFKTLDWAAGEFKLGADIGRITPYVVGGAGFARATTGGAGFTGGADSLNAAFGGASRAQAFGTIGVGATYHVTDKFSVGVEVRGVVGPGFGGT